MPSNPNELPADFEFPEELPADFFAAQPGELGANVAYPPDVVPQEQAPPLSWWEAAFPRSVAVADRPAYDPRALAAAGLDVVTFLGRAYASLARPEGESYADAMARLSPPAVMPQAEGRIGSEGSDRFAESVLRDPATAALSVIPGAWLGRALSKAPVIFRGAGVGSAYGSGVAATRQAENLAAGRDLSGGEVARDVAVGSGLGTGFGLIGAGLTAAGRAAAPAAMKLAKVGVKYREAVEKALPEMIQRGILAPTVGGMERNAARMEQDITGRYAAAKVGTEGVPAISLGLYGSRAAGKVRDLADRAAIGPDDEAAAAEWIMSRAMRPKPAPGGASPGMVDVPTAITARSQARKAAGSYESQAPTSARREAMQEAADEFAAGINERMGVVAPEVRAVDQFAAPYYQFRPYLDAIGRRGNNYEIGLTELGAAGLGGTVGSAGGPLGSAAGAIPAALLARAQRSPAYPWALAGAGRLGARMSQTPGVFAGRIGLGLRGSQTDNARGR